MALRKIVVGIVYSRTISIRAVRPRTLVTKFRLADVEWTGTVGAGPVASRAVRQDAGSDEW